MFQKLKDHIGHKIELVAYGKTQSNPENVAIECVDCYTVLIEAEPSAIIEEVETRNPKTSPLDTEIVISKSKELDTLASTKDTSALGDAADAGFGEETFEALDFEGCIHEGVMLAECAFEHGQTEIWEINTYPQVLYFVGSYVEVLERIQALPEE